MRFGFVFNPCDLYVGFFWSKKRQTLYCICLTVGFKIRFTDRDQEEAVLSTFKN